MATREAARADGKFMVICTTPDVCKTPPSGVPVPYPIVGVLQDHLQESKDVRFMGKWAMTMNSRLTKVTGNEAGAMGGVVSGVNTNFCRPVTFAPTFRVNGFNVLYHDGTIMEMNCAGPEGPGNTVGKLVFQGSSASAPMGPDGPPPGDPTVLPEIPAEEGFIGKLLSVDGIAGLAQMAPQLATMDWSNPLSALGAVGGLCGLGGWSDLAAYAAYAQQAAAIAMDPKSAVGLLGPLGNMLGLPGSQLMGLATTDWSNPGSVAGAAVNLAGMNGCWGATKAPTEPNPPART